MRAAFIEQLGPAENIRFGELPDPEPAPTDVLVRVWAGTVNPVDTLVRSGGFRTPMAFPFVVGRDLVGTVERPGAAVAGFAPGELVWCNSLGHGGRQGAAAELALVPPDRLYRVPPGVDPQDLLALAHPAATAYLALFVHGRVRPADTVYVAGAAGNVGAALVAMAAGIGAPVVASCSARDIEYCHGVGAEYVFDYADPDLTRRLRDASPGGFDFWIDTSGSNDLATAVDLLAPRGRIVLMSGASAQPVLPIGPFYLKDATLAGFVISHASVSELAESAANISRLVRAGTLRPRAVEVCPLPRTAEAHRRMESGGLHGKRLIVATDPQRWNDRQTAGADRSDSAR